ncbi:hypothetical protein HYZ64_02445 [Candidatus Berkelbacteria bacterium]|nr:hypothetical protein [Candidatus Berkelbacteria bacterium]
MTGKFIVLHGVNRVGKSTQQRLLAHYLESQGHNVEIIKYPVYEVPPSGRYLNAILRKGARKDISTEEMQLWYTINRHQFQSKLTKMLESGTWIVSEDYIGTGIAWGMVEGADIEWLETINQFLVPADFEILLDGPSFPTAREAGHRHEDNDKLLEKARTSHLNLAKRYNWPIIAANQPPDKVHAQLVNLVMQKLLLVQNNN